MLGFSFSLPATKLALAGIDPWLVATGRAVAAALLALAYLAVRRAPRPSVAQLRRLAVVAGGVVLGFPVLSSLALTQRTATHGAVVVGVLPAITAMWAVLRVRERPPALFWLASTAGVLTVIASVVLGGRLGGGPAPADGYLLGAVVVCGLGYAEGGALARELGGAYTICWALVLASPVTAGLTAAMLWLRPPHAGAPAWFGFGYLAAVSTFLAFFAWYAGLARGGVARVGQVQLAQPLLTLVWARLVLDEHLHLTDVVAALVVVLCVFATQRARRAGPTGPSVRPAAVMDGQREPVSTAP